MSNKTPLQQNSQTSSVTPKFNQLAAKDEAIKAAINEQLQTVINNVVETAVAKENAKLAVEEAVEEAKRAAEEKKRAADEAKRAAEEAKRVAKEALKKDIEEIAKALSKEVVKKALKKADDIAKTNQNLQRNAERSKYGVNTQKEIIPSQSITAFIVDYYKGINKSQAEQLNNKIAEMLDKVINKNIPINPKFYATSYEFKKLKVICADEFSLNWLEQMVANLPPPWEGARLEVTLLKNKQKPLLRPNLPPIAEVEFLIPDGVKKMEFDEVIKHIEKRNQIKTDSWHAWKRKFVPNGTFYHVYVSKESLEEIKRKGGRLFYRLGTVEIHIPNKLA